MINTHVLYLNHSVPYLFPETVFRQNMDFLYRERGAGKRTVKPSKVSIFSFFQRVNTLSTYLVLISFYNIAVVKNYVVDPDPVGSETWPKNRIQMRSAPDPK
jgi:hypothetical protein